MSAQELVQSRVCVRKAGREMDALIAERVFGWEWRRAWGDDRGLTPIKALFAPGELYDSVPLRGDESVAADALRDVPAYSTDVGLAWQVAEKLSGFVSKRAHPWWSVAVFHAQRNQVGCRVYACPPGSNIFDVHDVIAEDVGDTPAHAICLAALAALESESLPPRPTGGEE